MRTLYSPVTHGFIMQLSYRQYHETQTFHILLETIHLNIINVSERCGTYIKKFALISSCVVRSGGHIIPESGWKRKEIIRKFVNLCVFVLCETQ